MTLDPVALYHLFAKKPFQPMRVIAKDGKTFDIPSRQFVIVGHNFLDIGRQAPNQDEGIWAEGYHVPLDTIDRIEPFSMDGRALSSEEGNSRGP